MARIKRGSRHIVLLAAFVSVMSAAGGLIGAVTGAVFVLLFRSVFNMSTGIAEFVMTLVLLGALLSAVYGLILTLGWPSRAQAPVGKGAPAVASVAAAQPVDGQ